MARRKSAVRKTRFTLWLPTETTHQLERLQRTMGKGSVAEVVREAIDVYGALLAARERGVELYYEDQKAEETGRIWLLPGPVPGGRR